MTVRSPGAGVNRQASERRELGNFSLAARQEQQPPGERRPQRAAGAHSAFPGAIAHHEHGADDFARIIDAWMADPSIYAAVRENFLKLRYEEDPTVLIDELVNLANEVARHEFVKEIAHRVHEHRSGPAPAKRLIEALGMEDDVLGGMRRQPRAF